MTKEDEDKIQIPLRLSRDVHNELCHAIVDRNTSFQALMTALLLTFLHKERKRTKKPRRTHEK